jgi:hypothetical protein
MQEMQGHVRGRQPVTHLPRNYAHWARNKSVVDRVFQISKVDEDRPLVIASCCKSAAKKLLAALSTQEGRFAITARFDQPVFPGIQGIER